MTCVAATTFRLLDDRVGWDARGVDGLTDVEIDDGALVLRHVRRELPPGLVMPPRLAWMCATCTWWLGTRTGLRRLGPCERTFTTWLETPGPAGALAARGVLLAAVVAGEGVRVFDVPSERQIGEFLIPDATAVSLTPWNKLLVGGAHGRLWELERSGLPCSECDTGSPIAQLAHPVAGPCRTVVIHPGATGPFDDLAPTGVTAATELGFCLGGRGCFDWDGEPLDPGALGPGDDRYVIAGTYLSEPLDSGIPGCRWHRVRLDAAIPAGTAVQVAVATATLAGAAPDAGDWFEAGPDVTDITITAPPGRYAHLRLQLSGDGFASPAVHQVRLDMPRHTSLDELPAVYSDDLDARDFSERFLSLFDAQLEELDEVIARRDALLDPDALPDDALGWLAGLLGLGFESEMTVAQRRALIAAAPDLYHRRGTPSGLADILRTALGIDASVEELAPMRPWGAVGAVHLGQVRLFGRSRARTRLGSSTLGTASLISRGSPDDDARLWGASRIVVTIPAGSPLELVQRVVRSQTPAHVVATVRMRAPGFVLTDLRVGIDTLLSDPPPAVVGRLRLGRGGVLARGHACGSLAIVGAPLLALPTTRME
jgi:phage tail-like protein